jgi:hypothetical protein
MDLEFNSCSKENIKVPSFLALHTTHENHRSNCPDTQEDRVTTSENLLPYVQYLLGVFYN